MIKIERQAKILQIVRERGFVENEELARFFAVTSATIRRDLKGLSEQGLVRMDHGGSSVTGLIDSFVEPLYETKVYLNHEAKRAIGMAAAAMVQEDEVIILDSGTTNAQIAHSLRALRPKHLTVVTCDLIVAKELCPVPMIDVILLGGSLRRSFYSTYGPYTEAVLKNMRANKFFLGIDAASRAFGITNIVLEEVPIKQLAIQNSDQVIMVTDASKLGKNALHRVCSWEAIHVVITDQCINPEYLDFLETQNFRTQVVSPPILKCDERDF
jgi:DeoR/GlpR family transcriptional regulator of sugar metabolism